MRKYINSSTIILGDFMPKTSKAQSQASNKYAAKSYDRFYPFAPKGHKAEVQAAADRAGESLNEYIMNAVDQRMEREKNPHPRPQYQTDEAIAAIAGLKKKNPPD